MRIYSDSVKRMGIVMITKWDEKEKSVQVLKGEKAAAKNLPECVAPVVGRLNDRAGLVSRRSRST